MEKDQQRIIAGIIKPGEAARVLGWIKGKDTKILVYKKESEYERKRSNK